MFDEHVLQYAEGGESGECELVVGLDFGTSASKVVVQAPDLLGGQAFAVDFGEAAHSSMPYLLPTRLWVSPDGTCSLVPRDGAQLVNDIKLELFASEYHLYSTRGPIGRNLNPEAAAVAYLALLLRYARGWFLKSKRDVIGHFQKLVWSMNLGVPSPCVEDNEENRRFRRVGKAAWMLSVMEGGDVTIGTAQDELRHIIEAPEYWERDDDGTTCDFEIIPEIAAGAAGYALSVLRREGIHLMIDVGASTVDVCSFVLHEREGTDRYDLLTADVQQLGTIRLHHERILAIQRVHEAQAQSLRDEHDPLAPMSTVVDSYLPPRDKVVEEVNSAEAALQRRCRLMLRRVIRDLRTRRAPADPTWQGARRLPILLIGGGTRLEFFADLGRWGDGTRVVPVPVPQNLGSEVTDFDRLAVAWGLSHRALDVGEITPADQIEDAEPLAKRHWEDAYVSKDQV
ncbi:MAG: hypothetical protein KC503_34075 [Myxococcales bacterium]|nr:hypothetical protein [Myxococcales bacterium]